MWGKSVDYPYLFQTSGYDTIDQIRAELESQPEWDWSSSSAEADTVQEMAAQRFGFLKPFNTEQAQLASYLRTKCAGLHMATYAWGLYAQSQTRDHRRYA